MEVAIGKKKKSHHRKTGKGSKHQSTELLEASSDEKEIQDASNSRKKKKCHHGKTVKGSNHQPTEPTEASDEESLDPCMEASKRKRKYSEKAISSESGQCYKKPKVHRSERSDKKKKKRKKQSREVADDDVHQISRRHKKHKTVPKGKVYQLIIAYYLAGN